MVTMCVNCEWAFFSSHCKCTVKSDLGPSYAVHCMREWDFKCCLGGMCYGIYCMLASLCWVCLDVVGGWPSAVRFQLFELFTLCFLEARVSPLCFEFVKAYFCWHVNL